jgi:hypothetical protein
VVVKRARQLRLDREGLAEELLVELLSGLLQHEHAARVGVFRRSTGVAHHLEKVGDGVVGVSVVLSVKVLDAHNDDHVSREREAPSRVLVENGRQV